MKISVCTIMKNEIDNLPVFLEVVSKHGFGAQGGNGEIVLVDTGSTDGSLEYARERIGEVHQYTWNGDFSAARNYAASKAKNDIILVLDVDELITEFDAEAFEKQLYLLDGNIGNLHINNYSTTDGIRSNHFAWLPRIYNRNLCHFERSIHEQVAFKDGRKKCLVDFPIEVDHTGYDLSKDKLEKKAERNNDILFKEIDKNPNDPYLYFQVGQSYLLIRDHEKALPWFEKAIEFDLDASEQYVQMIITGYGECLLNLGRAKDALCLSSVYEDMKEYPEYVFMMGQIYLNNNQLMTAYKEFFACLSLENERVSGMTTYFPLHNIGVINEMLGEKNAAIQFYEKAAKYGYKRSQERLEELKAEM